MKTQAAEVSNLIKAELKKSFPTVKFSVKSESYSGGNSVRINYTNGPMTKQVEAIVNKYRGGHFDGMVDMYIHGAHVDHPTVKFVFVNREVSDSFLIKWAESLSSEYGLTDGRTLDTCFQDTMGRYTTVRQMLFRMGFHDEDLTGKVA